MSSTHSHNRHATTLWAACVFGLTTLGLFSHVMLAELSHNEHMYISAGVLVQEHDLYRDFAFLQMPYLPLLYGAFYSLTGTGYFLLVGRLFTFAFMALSAVLMAIIAFHFTRSQFMALGTFHLFAFNWLVLFPAQEASNYLMPMAFSLLGLYLLLRVVAAANINIMTVVLSGFVLGVAVGSRLTYLALLPPFFLVALFYPGLATFRARLRLLILPLVGGTVIGLLPVIYYLLQDWDVFLFDNLGYHIANTAWRYAEGSLLPISFSEKLGTVLWLGIRSGNAFLLLLLCIPLLAISGSTPHSRVQQTGAETELRYSNNGARFACGLLRFRLAVRPLFSVASLLVLLLVLCGTVATLLPTPFLYQYLAVPIPFLILLLPCWYGRVESPRAQRFIKLGMLPLLFVFLLGSQFAPFTTLAQLPCTNDWTGIAIHNLAEQMRDLVVSTTQTDALEPVATLSPLFVLDAGLEIYPELSTGPFLFRIGDLLSYAERTHYIGTSPETITLLLDDKPPLAILVGFETTLDQPLIEYAETHGYVPIEGDLWGGVLYVPDRVPGND